MGLDEDDSKLIKPLCLMTAKPTMYVANVDENGFEDNPLLQTVIDLATAEGAGVVAICAAIESEIAELEDEEKIEFLSELGQDEPGLNRVIRAGYELLGLQTYFTAGKTGSARLDDSQRLYGRRKQQVLSILILSAVLFEQKQPRLLIMINMVGSWAQRKPVSFALKEKST